METKNATGGAALEVAQPTRVRPMPPPGFVLLLAILAIGWAGPLVRFTTAPALVVASWRMLFSVALIALVLTLRREWGQLARLGRGEWTLAVASGLLLALHFWSWIASLGMTTVASSVALVATQPVFVALFSALFLGENAARRQWIGIAVAIGGAVVIGWGDFGGGANVLLGDVLALAGAVFASGYYVIGRRLRRDLGLWVYIGVVYGVSALALTLASLLSPGVALTGFASSEWLVFLALAAGPMMIGHTGINYALRYVPAYVANLTVLGEPVVATAIAWLLPAIGEVPSPQVVAGGLLVLAGIGLGRKGGS